MSSINPVSLQQPFLSGLCPITSAVEALATTSAAEVRGAVFTRREIVEFILDLAGYCEDRRLYDLRVLEPSFGGGDFLLVIAERLLNCWQSSDQSKDAVAQLSHCIRAVELHQGTFHATRANLIQLLGTYGLSVSSATELANCWLIHGDFLLTELSGTFNAVVGNPPYVRQELIPDVLLAEYRKRYTTVYDRADLYVPFIERSLHALSDNGKLGFICSDRWTKNRYGGPLRKLVADKFQLQIYVDMVDIPAFQDDVIAYPAITIIGRERTGMTRVAHRPSIEGTALSGLVAALQAKDIDTSITSVREIANVAVGAEPWLLDSPERMALIRRLEAQFSKIEDVGCKIGIGVATGADKAFIGVHAQLDVEPDRKLPLAMTRDIMSGEVRWRGLGVVNPFTDAGGLVNLDEHPKLKRYFEERKEDIAGRHCAQKSPANWYRTIDRITPSLAKTPKLLIPDIKGEAQIVYESGELYPHHNLYFITSVEWDLRALQAVLLSGIARLFVATYSTKMRGGYLRFQAQYLRRIHMPRWSEVSDALRVELKVAAGAKDLVACNRAVSRLYGLNDQESAVLSGVTSSP